MRDIYEQIINSLTSGVMAVDGSGAIIMVNSAARAHLHATEEELAPGTPLRSLKSLQGMADVFDEVRGTGEALTRREFVLEQPGDERKEIGLSASLLEGSETFNGVIFLFIDMTERRSLERAAELNRQLASLGELTAGVVHELRNPVSVISGMAEVLKRKLGEEHELHKAADTIFREAGGLERSISQFLGLARPFALKPAPCHPCEIADRAVQLCQRRATRKQVGLDALCGEGVPEIQADRERLAQALANIINNGIDAVEEEGQVAMHISRDDDTVLFTITDNGPGIHLGPGESLFNPFFTKKEGGTGLGLTIVHRIIAAHQGAVSYENREEGGARFIVRLPIEPHSRVKIVDSEF